MRGYTESMVYGMPSYERRGQVQVGFGKQARYLSLYILKQPVFEAHRAELGGLGLGKGCIRYRQPDQIDWAVGAPVSWRIPTPAPTSSAESGRTVLRSAPDRSLPPPHRYLPPPHRYLPPPDCDLLPS